jgi:ABC-type transport system involved in Fe-S cluster assembly fused permease/ATPase subunit
MYQPTEGRILVVDGGVVQELGSHDDLIPRDGLYQLQARAYA